MANARTSIAAAGFEIKKLQLELAEKETEIAALKADLVWSAKNVVGFYGGMLTWVGESVLGPINEASCDGTPDDILRAVREARTRG